MGLTVAVVTTLVTALIGGYGTAAVAVGVGDKQVELDAPASVVGSGPNGSVSVPITPGATGPVPVRLSGLVAGVRVPNPDDAANPVTGRAETGDESLFRVEVPAGSAFVRFELDSFGNGAGTNLDLGVFFDRPGEESVTWDSQSEAAGERVDISEAPAGSYRVVITTVEGASDFTLTTFTVASGSNGGTLTATPSTLAGTAGATANIGLSWTGLVSADSGAAIDYLGVVDYGDTGMRTVLTVAPGERVPAGAADPGGPLDPGSPALLNASNVAPPSILGTAEVGRTLRARAGAWDPADLDFVYRWQADEVDIPGATRSHFRVPPAVAGTTVTLVVTATAAGFSPALAVSSGVRVLAESEVTLSLNRSAASVGRTIFAHIRVVSPDPGQGMTGQGETGHSATSQGDRAQSGEVVVTVDGREYTVELGRGGRATFTLPELEAGTHRVSASWAGTSTVAGDESPTARLRLRSR